MWLLHNFPTANVDPAIADEPGPGDEMEVEPQAIQVSSQLTFLYFVKLFFFSVC